MTVTTTDDVTERARVNGKSQAFPGDYSAMTLREYIATAALQGMLASPLSGSVEQKAAVAVGAADALLIELAK